MNRASKASIGRRRVPRLRLTVAICLAISGTAQAQEAATPPPATDDETPMLEAVEVTAQKRTENLQKVPISLTVLGEQKLDELNVTDFEDYVKFLPSVSYQSLGPGFAQIYMRGVASGGDGNHSGSLPSVGVYLDEQPVTTIEGPLDLHIYDVARVESLAGPQGTLYGASAQAGALRIITNKPDPTAFSAGYSLEVNSVNGGGMGNVEEGFVNVPLSESAAIRLVGWHQHDAGYIDNVEGERTFPSSGITVTNRDCTSTATLVCTGAAEDDYNDVETIGARLALKLDLNENWSVTPTIMGQHQKADGNFAFDPVVGEREITHFYPEHSEDKWWQGALTVQGKIGNFELTYAYAHLKRDVDADSDYSDYSFWYDTLYSYGAYLYDNDGALINPSQYIQGKAGFTKTSHELRLASAADNRFRFVVGLFWENQFNDIEQRYKVDNLADSLDIYGWPDTLWLTKQERRDHDEAIFGEMSFDFIPDKLTGTVGARHFRARNGLQGFFGFSAGFYPGSSYGEQVCVDNYGPDPANWPSFNGAPCSVFDKEVNESGTLGKANLSWNITPNAMIYGTWSEGYRPGGINRRGTLPPYLADYLTNWEFGWKTSWMQNRLSFNGSIFREEWKDFQFSILGANGLTEIKNANQAQIDGMELALNWAATYNLRLGAAAAWYDAELTANYCGFTDADGNPVTDCADPEAPEGTQLPVTPKFKGNITARYTWDMGELSAFVQGAVVHVGERKSDLRLVERDILGDLDAYTVTDISAGISKDNWSLSFYVNNLFDEVADLNHFANCSEGVCGASGVDPTYPNGQVYNVSNQPRTFGIKWEQDF
jgi:outer membrane receptor protein involved in Fe transport